jgi:PAS domain S-box-containing protein
MRRLMPLLMSVMIALVAVFVSILWIQQNRRLDDIFHHTTNALYAEYEAALKEQANGLAFSINAISGDKATVNALRSGDAGTLLTIYQPMYQRLHEAYGLSHFYFITPGRKCLLRVHTPERKGDRIDRYTLRRAEETGKFSSGLELGVYGTLVLRAVQPVYADGGLIGYIELGKEVEDIIQNLHDESGIGVAITVKKKLLDRTKWEEGTTMLRRNQSWDFFRNDALIYSSLGVLPASVENFLLPDVSGKSLSSREMQWGGKPWRVASMPLRDVSGVTIGSMMFMLDVSSEKGDFYRLASMAVVLIVLALASLLGFLFVVLSRTDRGIRDREQALMMSREQYMLAVNGSHDGIWDWDIRSNSAYFSPKWKQMIGYDDEEFPNTFSAFENNIHPDDRNRVLDHLDRYLKDEISSYSAEFRFRHKDGSFRWVLARGEALRDAKGIPYRMAGSHSDITDRKKAEEELKMRSEFQLVLMDLAIGFVNKPLEKLDEAINHALELAGEFTGVDRTYLFSYDFEKDTMTNTYEWCAEGISPEISNLQNIPNAMAPGWVNSHRAGQLVHVPEVAALPEDSPLRQILEPQGIRTLIAIPLVYDRECFGFVGFDAVRELKSWSEEETSLLRMLAELFTNAEIRHRHETALVDARFAAEAANRAKSEFLANMSHEIRTPMNGIIGMTGLLLDTSLGDEQRGYARNILASGESLLALINDILDFSKIEARKLDLEILDFDLLNLLDNFAAMMAIRANDKGLEFICAASPDVPTLLQGDPVRLLQILNNLAGNAVKFTNRGEVAVRVTMVSENDHEVLLRFSVKDTGIGVPADKIDFLFESFTQVDASTTRKFGGTGLGLAISKQLTTMMNGQIGVNSVPSKGSEFWFTVCLVKQADRSQIRIPHPDSIKNARILVVDDNATNREVLRIQLRSWGARVEETPGSRDALSALNDARDRNDPFRLAILDMQMPEMDGRMLAKAIKSDVKVRDTLLVMMTSIAKNCDSDHLEFEGFEACLEKPVRQSELFNTLVTVLAGSRKTFKPWLHVMPHSEGDISALDLPEGNGRPRILLAEDSLINQQVAVGILKKLGFKAEAVANGAEALKALEQNAYDLVLMDIQMPEMDGLEATRRIRDPQSAVRDHEIPVIAMTAHVMQGDREICLEAGMNDYVSKPINPHVLADVLKRWLA